MIKCCIFDLDGTVLDTINSITHFVNLALQKWGIKEITVEQGKTFAGNGARKLIERACANGGVTDDDTVTAVLRYYNEIYDKSPLLHTKPFDGILQMLDAMEDKGIRLALLSNKPDSTVKSIASAFFKGKFCYVAGGRDGVPLKPDPESARELMTELSLNPCDIMFVGDTAVDIETGKNMHAHTTVGVLWGFRKREELEGAGADVIVATPAEILEYI